MPVFQGAACWILRLSNAQHAHVNTAAIALLGEGLNLQLCLCAHEFTAQLLSCHSASFMTPGFWFFLCQLSWLLSILGNTALIMSFYHLLCRKLTVAVLSYSQSFLILISKLCNLKLQSVPY